MSNFIKYYSSKKDKKNKKITHEAMFIDARGNFPERLRNSKSYYYVTFTKIGKDESSKKFTVEDFDDFIKGSGLEEVEESDLY